MCLPMPLSWPEVCCCFCLFVSGPESHPETHDAFSCHVSSISFNLEQLFSLFLS